MLPQHPTETPPAAPLALSDRVVHGLRCPVTGQELRIEDGALITVDGKQRYALTSGGVPLLVDPANELFGAVPPRASAPPGRAAGAARALLARLPTPNVNVGAPERLRRVGELLHESAERPLVLVIGGGTLGAGMEQLARDDEVELLETDVFVGPRTRLVCDAHALPFADGTFSGVVCQAVLEHVLDPGRVVEEIHRVLEPGGLVYSEIPFMQQVHEGAHDFTRFTHLGHRRLYRHFDEIESGAQGGPGMALAWSIRHFAMAFSGGSRARRALIRRLVGALTAWLTLFDARLVRTPDGLDAASGTYFIGRRSDRPVPDAEIVAGYRGACPTP